MKMKCLKIPEFDHERFLSKIKINQDTSCWEWGAYKDKKTGYGKVYFKKKEFSAHRTSYDLFVGIKEDFTVIDHMCRNKGCVNPDHLREVTVQVNTLENSACSAVDKKAQTHCIRGHEFTKENTLVSYGVYGGIRRNCIICSRETKRKWQLKNYKYEYRNGTKHSRKQKNTEASK